DVSAKDDITQSVNSVISSAGETTLASTNGDITLTGNNDFAGTVNASGKDVALNDVNGIELGAVTSSGTLDVSAKDDITQSVNSVISSAGETTLASTNGDITLTGNNDFAGTVNASGKDVALNDVNGIELGAVTSSGTLDVSAKDDITQSVNSVISSAGETTLASTNGDITLSGLNNSFKGLINLDAKNANINSKDRLNLGDVTLVSKLKGTGAPIENTLNSSDIVNILIKDFNNIEKNINNINLSFFNLQKNQKIGNVNLENFNLEKLSSNKIDNILLFSTPPESTQTEKITLSELVSAKKSESQSDISISLAQDSIIELINGGVNLPEGVDQEFYIVKQELRDEKEGINQ
ncbi:hypothetical protein, partial [Arcobacter aquimarinus]|uniref:hypothetical protein n=1 Tax=Arcobacter aquimarinus TaxID=1315211 RepID=UPI003BAEC54C